MNFESITMLQNWVHNKLGKINFKRDLQGELGFLAKIKTESLIIFAETGPLKRRGRARNR